MNLLGPWACRWQLLLRAASFLIPPSAHAAVCSPGYLHCASSSLQHPQIPGGPSFLSPSLNSSEGPQSFTSLCCFQTGPSPPSFLLLSSLDLPTKTQEVSLFLSP